MECRGNTHLDPAGVKVELAKEHESDQLVRGERFHGNQMSVE